MQPSPTRPITALYIDLDRFKEINDSYGHDVGDRFLIELSTRIDAVLDSRDALFRMGGDELLVLAPHRNETQGMALANEVGRAIAKPIVIDGDRLKPSASIGVAVVERNGIPLPELIKEADAALYAAKAAGRAQAVLASPLFSRGVSTVDELADELNTTSAAMCADESDVPLTR